MWSCICAGSLRVFFPYSHSNCDMQLLRAELVDSMGGMPHVKALPTVFFPKLFPWSIFAVIP